MAEEGFDKHQQSFRCVFRVLSGISRSAVEKYTEQALLRRAFACLFTSLFSSHFLLVPRLTSLLM